MILDVVVGRNTTCFVVERMACSIAAAADCWFSLTSCDGELGVVCQNVTALVGVGRGRVHIVRNRTCLIDAASAADFSLSSCHGEREALAMSCIVVLSGGVLLIEAAAGG